MSTICAISTPPGTGGIAVARISGPAAIETVDRVWRGKRLALCDSHTAHLGHIIDPERGGEPLDQAVATIFRAPNSFTGEDTVELSVHGSRFVQAELIRLLCRNGARLAEPGEFTRRAFAAGKMDLAQAEAVADVIVANSRAALRIANNQMRGAFSQRLADLRQQLLDLAALLELELDFSEEDVEFASRDRLRELASQILAEIERLRASFAAGTAIKDGIPVAIAGPTNAGKSSLLNALLNDDRAIVSDIHGTTRDTVEDTLAIGDHLFRIIDTAGIRETTDTIEQAGIQRSRKAISRASVILAVTDAATSTVAKSPANAASHPDETAALLADLRATAPDTPIILLRNKTDLLSARDEVPPSHTELSPSHRGERPSCCSELPAFRAEPPSSYRGEAYAELPPSPPSLITLSISAKTGQGIDTLRSTLSNLADTLTGSATSDAILVTNQRHYDALSAATAPLHRLLAALTPAPSTSLTTPSDSVLSPSTTSPSNPIPSISFAIPLDLMAQDLRETLTHLASITGTITAPDILSTIFSRFCIGK